MDEKTLRGLSDREFEEFIDLCWKEWRRRCENNIPTTRMRTLRGRVYPELKEPTEQELRDRAIATISGCKDRA